MKAFGLGLVFLAGCGASESRDAAHPRMDTPEIVPATTRTSEFHIWNTHCDAADGQYVMDHAPGYTAGFRRAPAGFESARTHLFWVHSDTTGRTYWYGFSLGTPPAALPVAGPEATASPEDGPPGTFDAAIGLYPVGLDGAIGYEPPQGTGARAEAPPLILATDLGPSMNMSPFLPRTTQTEDVPRAFFRLVRCGDRPVVWAADQGLAPAAP